jgi:hypothetical protein
MIDESMLRQKLVDQADAVVRVFMIKLRELLREIVKAKRFGETLAGKHKNDFSNSFLVIISDFFFFAVLYTIEFQKRGQPHAHILIFLKDRNILHDPYVIDKFINAEIPDKEADPLGYCNTPNNNNNRLGGVTTLQDNNKTKTIEI